MCFGMQRGCLLGSGVIFFTATAIRGGCVILIIKRGGIQHDIQHGEGANQNGIYGLGGEWNTLNVFLARSGLFLSQSMSRKSEE